MISAMETRRIIMFYAKDHHAAAVFNEAARLSYQLGQLWPQASALTSKVPAQSALSHANAQTHRLSVPVSDVSPVQCPKERV